MFFLFQNFEIQGSHGNIQYEISKPSSDNNLKSNQSIQTVSKALKTLRKQLNTLLPRSSIWPFVSNIVKEVSIQPTPSLETNCSSEKYSLSVTNFSNLLRRIISFQFVHGMWLNHNQRKVCIFKHTLCLKN